MKPQSKAMTNRQEALHRSVTALADGSLNPRQQYSEVLPIVTVEVLICKCVQFYGYSSTVVIYAQSHTLATPPKIDMLGELFDQAESQPAHIKFSSICTFDSHTTLIIT